MHNHASSTPTDPESTEPDTARPSVAEREASLARYTRKQRGMFTIAQSIECGISATTRRRRIKAGLYEVVEPRVLRLAAAPRLDFVDRLYARYLSKRSVACGASAAGLYSWIDPPDEPDVIVPRSRKRGRGVVRSSVDLPNSDIAIVRGLPATNPVRTILTYGDHAKIDAVRAVITTAAARRMIRIDRLERRARELANPSRPGTYKVLQILAELHPDLQRIRSEWEGLVLALCDQYGLSRPEVNYRVVVDGHVRFLDVAWAAVKVFGEFDGYGVHLATEDVFDDDRNRQNALVEQGWLPFRMTARLLRDQPEVEFARLSRTIRRRLDSLAA
jgi:hypothetical protein